MSAVTLETMQKAISGVLRSSCPGHMIYAGEVVEGVKKPCFFIQIIPVTSDIETEHTELCRYMVVITYFSKDSTALENIQMRDMLRTAIGRTLTVGDRHLTPLGSRSEIVDRTLQYQFDLRFYDEPPAAPVDPVEIMRNVKIAWEG